MSWTHTGKCSDCGTPIAKHKCPSGRCHTCSSRYNGKYHRRVTNMEKTARKQKPESPINATTQATPAPQEVKN